MEEKRFFAYDVFAGYMKFFINNVGIVSVASLLMVIIVIIVAFSIAISTSIMTQIMPLMATSEKSVWFSFVSSSSLEISIFVGLIVLVMAGLSAGYTGLCIDLYDTGESNLKRIFSFFKYTFTILSAGVLYYSLTILGLICCVLPGIYIAVRLSLYKFFIIDRNVGCLKAFSMSWQATRFNVWSIMSIDTIIGMLTSFCGLSGIFLYMAFRGLIYVVTYRILIPKKSL